MSVSNIQFGQLPALLLRAPDGAEATITLYGAHLVSWKAASSTGAAPQERMFMSRLSALDGSRALRGGVPVIFPQFAERGSGMRHGFARVSTWRVLDSGEQDGAAHHCQQSEEHDGLPAQAVGQISEQRAGDADEPSNRQKQAGNLEGHS